MTTTALTITPTVADQNVTADLTDVFLTKAFGGGQVAIGYVKGDTKGRFDDGERIRTSLVEKIEGDLIHTMNSVYRVLEWRNDANASA